MFLLDTNVVSELRRTERADISVVRWSQAQDPATFHISVVTLMEIRHGALLIQRRDARQAAVFLRWLNDRILSEFRERTIPVSAEIALACAALHVPNPKSERDAWIAATALVLDMTVVTRNTRDFDQTGAKLFNPWEQ
jgi:predicted nucleic acid-binding protein